MLGNLQNNRSEVKLTDPGSDKVVDVYIRSESALYSDLFSGKIDDYENREKLDGLTVYKIEIDGVKTQNYLTKEEYFNVRSPRGENTILIVIDRAIIDKGRVLAHEGGHGLFDIKYMMKLIKWYADNPGESKGGHGGGNPSGEEADRQEKIYINEKIKRTKQ